MKLIKASPKYQTQTSLVCFWGGGGGGGGEGCFLEWGCFEIFSGVALQTSKPYHCQLVYLQHIHLSHIP